MRKPPRDSPQASWHRSRVVLRSRLVLILSLLAGACTEAPTTRLTTEPARDATTPSARPDSEPAPTTDASPTDAAATLDATSRDANANADPDAGVAGECTTARDCVARRGLAVCEPGYGAWACTSGACVLTACERLGCTSSCQCTSMVCADGACALGPIGAPCPSWGTPGTPCASNADCSEGLCLPESTGFPGGYCTTACAASGSCPRNAACEPHAETTTPFHGLCLPECTRDDECRAGYACVFPTEASLVRTCWPRG